MKKRVGLFVLSLALGFSALAQTPRKKAGESQKGKRGMITLTGCLEAGFDRNVFTLENVYSAHAESTVVPSRIPRSESSYLLIPAGDVDLIAHTGHKVEVTGTPVQGANNSAAAGKAEFRVNSIRHIANSCP